MEGIRSDPNLRGIIPRTFDQIFDFINTSDQNSGKKFLVAISYVEIYSQSNLERNHSFGVTHSIIAIYHRCSIMLPFLIFLY